MAILKISGDWKGAREAMLATEKGMKRLSTGAKSIFGKIGGMFSSMLSPLGFGLGGLGAATVFTTIVNKMDDIGKASARMGVSAEYFQKMKFAADRSGTSIDAVQAAIGKVAGMVGRFKMGDARAAKVFNWLGITPEDLAGLNTEQTFDKVNRAIAAIGDEQQRNAIKSKLYGDSFQQLNNFLKDYVQLGDEAKSRGLIIDDKTIKAAEGLKDAMTNAGTAFMAALAGSGAVEWLNDVAQNLDAAARMENQKKGTGVQESDLRPGWRKALFPVNNEAGPLGIGSAFNFLNRTMDSLVSGDALTNLFGNNPTSGFGGSAGRQISQLPWQINATPELLQGIGGKDKLEDYVKAIDEAKNAIMDLTNSEAIYINNAGTFAEVEKRKAELLEKRTEAERAARPQKEVDTAKAVARSVLGKTTPDEQKLLDKADTEEEIYAALDKITDAREKQKELAEQRLADLDKELKYQRMILDGKAREVEIEKALEKEAKAQGVDVSKLDPATAERIRNATGSLYDIKNIPKVETAQFPTDSLRRVGGMSGAIASSVSGVNYAKSSAESLKSIDTKIGNIERNTASGSGLTAP